MNDLPAGWKKGATSAEDNSLLKIYITQDINTTFNYLDRIRQAVLESDFSDCTFMTLSNDCLTVTINDLGGKKSVDKVIGFARVLDSLLKV